MLGQPQIRSPLPIWPRPVRRAAVTVLALLVSTVVMGVLALGLGTLPGLGQVLDPGQGVWAVAASGVQPSTQTLSLPGLPEPVQVSFTESGLAAIQAPSDAGLYQALGYVQARFRLTQMDLQRRIGEGLLSQLVGPSGVSSDEFELRLGLLRTAQAELAAIPAGSAARTTLDAYAAGVNDWIAQARASHQLPAVYTLAGVSLAAWTPLDSLVIQEVLTQVLGFTTAPLDYETLERSLGATRTMQWFPVQATDQQRPFDPGPYHNLGLSPITRQNADAAAATLTAAQTSASTSADARASAGAQSAEAASVAALLAQIDRLPASELHLFPDSNAWAANGPAVAGAGAMLAGDPHLLQTLPSYWFESALRAPGIDATGVGIPGVPGILIGHNAHISWSMADTGNQAAFFYAEKTSPSRPGQYYWRGSWRPMEQLHYVIPVRGAEPVSITASLTVHGPVLTQDGLTTSVDWMGDYPSGDLPALLGVDSAANFQQFSSALQSWKAPNLDFVYADDHGNIGAIAAGYYPEVQHGSPWLPLPGTGDSDIAGTIPYAAVPRVYDPPDHIVVAANQRPVGPDYPYYLGTTIDDFDRGYRADQIYDYLGSHHAMTMADFAGLQSNVTDRLAGLIVPRLLAALDAGSAQPTAAEQAARQALSNWNDSMSTSSVGATIWWKFWTDYLSAVFQPWWNAAQVPVQYDHDGLAVSVNQVSLEENLETWTLHDPGNAAFSPPGGGPRDAASVMTAAFGAAVSELSQQLGTTVSTWSWGRLHSREIPSLLQYPALGYGPRAAPGDPWTINAADDGLQSDFGPGWRMIVAWRGVGQADAEGVYPGGQSENPTSPWYENLIATWWSGRYLPLPTAAGGGGIVWTLRPATGGENR